MLITVLLTAAALAIWLPALLERGVAASGAAGPSSGDFHMLLADTDGWRQTADQSMVASQYDLRARGTLASLPQQLGRWQGEDVPSNETDLLGFSYQQHVFRQYADDQGEMIWLRLLASSDWRLFYHTPAICYKGNGWEYEAEESYVVALGENSLRLRGFAARLGSSNHLVLYTFLWPNSFRDMSEGATMFEVVVPFDNDKDQAWRDAQEFVRLIFADKPGAELSTVPQIRYRLDANLGNEVTLLGYDWSATTVRPGETIMVTLYWQAQRVLDRDYTIFVHILNPPGGDPQTRVLAQKDEQPFGGMFPTSQWEPGQVFKQVYELTIPADATVGSREVEVGMYLLSTGQRLNVLDAIGQVVSDSVVLPAVTIAEPGS